MDKVTLKMQQEVVNISQERLGKKLPEVIVKKIETKYLSYVGLEMIIDSVTSLEIEKLEKYLNDI